MGKTPRLPGRNIKAQVIIDTVKKVLSETTPSDIGIQVNTTKKRIFLTIKPILIV